MFWIILDWLEEKTFVGWNENRQRWVGSESYWSSNIYYNIKYFYSFVYDMKQIPLPRSIYSLQVPIRSFIPIAIFLCFNLKHAYCVSIKICEQNSSLISVDYTVESMCHVVTRFSWQRMTIYFFVIIGSYNCCITETN